MIGARFLDVADALDRYKGEEWERTRIGRLYYGVYLEYRQFAETRLGFSRLNLAREHRVIAELLQQLDPALANDLRILRLCRNQADYDLELPPEAITELLMTATPLAKAMMTRLDTLRNEQR